MVSSQSGGITKLKESKWIKFTQYIFKHIEIGNLIDFS